MFKWAITPKVGKPKLRFMFSARFLLVFYVCVKFHENTSNFFQLTKWTRVHGRNGYVQCLKGNNSKRRQTRVMVHVFCMSFYSALHLYEVWWKYIWQYQSYGVDRNDRRADGRTDRPTDTENFRRYNIIPSPLFVAGHKKYHNMLITFILDQFGSQWILWGSEL